MIDGVIGNKLLPADIRQDIIERTDGIPLFVEEMTRAVLEAKDEEAAERTVAAVPSPSIAVPPSLHASLMARLDRLGAAKEVAQIGAAIGRDLRGCTLDRPNDPRTLRSRSGHQQRILARQCHDLRNKGFECSLPSLLRC